ncbi:hypothetical protein HanRHA438_Chr16g0753641 [Helianthus annuus]|nr:hypothetical protein HanIR_Chr16g0806341 [Helianthus annuus]KAJ0835298.1 hypothetical protein HanRHA438_Chr16g0753641 [Helianthus annuus]
MHSPSNINQNTHSYTQDNTHKHNRNTHRHTHQKSTHTTHTTFIQSDVSPEIHEPNPHPTPKLPEPKTK